MRFYLLDEKTTSICEKTARVSAVYTKALSNTSKRLFRGFAKTSPLPSFDFVPIICYNLSTETTKAKEVTAPPCIKHHNMNIISTLSDELGISQAQTEKTVALIDDGNTIPFIARYRKEVTGSLDDTVLRRLYDRLIYLRGFEQRKGEISALIDGQGKLTPEITAALEAASTLTELEDIYRPYKGHRRTRASVARERGLEPLAELLFAQKRSYDRPLADIASDFIDEEKGVSTAEEALAGARDIIAEDISDNAAYRKRVRDITYRSGILETKQAKEGDSPYEMYYEHSEKLSVVPNHRVLAINRAEKEGYIRVSIKVDEALPLNYLASECLGSRESPAYSEVLSALSDSYDRLIAPSIERELRSDLTDRAGEGAIVTFSDNLRNLLLQPPVRGFTVMGYDPGYRTGCKLAVVDPTGKVLDTAVIYPTKPQERIEESRRRVVSLIRRYGVGAIAIGNGTASRESEAFIADTLREIGGGCGYVIVSEAGASVYSASELGAEEFPDFDVTQRSAVSIARRLQDPLAELVKIDPRSIGVGQYQHDMKQSRLGEALSGVVEYCVNHVGVDVNTASYSLLSHVAGINAASAKNIVKYREENGAFTSRAQIKKVPRIGARAFEQCAGFLRVSGGSEILDETGVHPESYAAARALLNRFSLREEDVRRGKVIGLDKAVREAGEAKLAAELGVGIPTLRDIVAELSKPGRDARDDLPAPILRTDVLTLDDLSEGMELTGTVRNVVDFGAFVDIGVHQDGLVHISQISKKRIAHPSEVLAIGDIVKVKIISLDRAKGRIGLTMKF